MRRPVITGVIVVSALAVHFGAVRVVAEESEPPAAPAGMVPIPDYTLPWTQRAHLAGDLGGLRTDAAESGIQGDVTWTQILQGVTDGGTSEATTRYGSTLDYNMVFDLQQMGVMPGAMIKVRAESRFGASVNGRSGSVLPVNTDGYFPLNVPSDDDVDIALTSLTYIQFLTNSFAVVAGKFDTLDGDANEFASGRGVSQFMNANLVFNPVTAISVPYSTLGFGAIWMPSPNVTITTNLMNRDDSSTSTGFDDIGEGWLSSTEAQVQYRLGDLPGGFNLGFIYAGDSDFADFSGLLVFQPGQGVALGTENETWSAYATVWQYVWAPNPREGPMNLTNGEPDLQGVGLFARFGVADDDTNPIDWTLSVGVGGRGVVPTRINDTFGVAYVYSSVDPGLFLAAVGVDDDAHVFEAFYNVAITPAVHLTFDIQLLDSPLPGVDTTTILGGRLSIRF